MKLKKIGHCSNQTPTHNIEQNNASENIILVLKLTSPQQNKETALRK